MSEWRTIDSAPKDGRKVLLDNKDWYVVHKARWDWVEGPDEDGKGGFCLWHLDDDSGGVMGDGLLWPDEDRMPSHWMPLPDPPD